MHWPCSAPPRSESCRPWGRWTGPAPPVDQSLELDSNLKQKSMHTVKNTKNSGWFCQQKKGACLLFICLISKSVHCLTSGLLMSMGAEPADELIEEAFTTTPLRVCITLNSCFWTSAQLMAALDRTLFVRFICGRCFLLCRHKCQSGGGKKRKSNKLLLLALTIWSHLDAPDWVIAHLWWFY